jgi:poly(3-hydroxyalkanoate) synthetase
MMAESIQTSEQIVPFTAGDGMPLNLIHVRGTAEPTRGPVIVVHGAGVRANLFRPPVGQTFVTALVEHGYDVWLENWRASIDMTPNEWTLDKAAKYDHPHAVETILGATGAKSLKAVIHCQG